jgi:hypothetical protein
VLGTGLGCFVAPKATEEELRNSERMPAFLISRQSTRRNKVFIDGEGGREKERKKKKIIRITVAIGDAQLECYFLLQGSGCTVGLMPMLAFKYAPLHVRQIY